MNHLDVREEVSSLTSLHASKTLADPLIVGDMSSDGLLDCSSNERNSIQIIGKYFRLSSSFGCFGIEAVSYTDQCKLPLTNTFYLSFQETEVSDITGDLIVFEDTESCQRFESYLTIF
jgi:hypothetical protein